MVLRACSTALAINYTRGDLTAQEALVQLARAATACQPLSDRSSRQFVAAASDDSRLASMPETALLPLLDQQRTSRGFLALSGSFLAAEVTTCQGLWLLGLLFSCMTNDSMTS